MIGTIIASLIKRAGALHTRPKRAMRRPWRAHVESLESRCLLSAYTLGQVWSLGANDTGAGPHSGLTADTAGDLFGTTSQGGAYGAGTVFEIPAGTSTLITLASFNGADGKAPYGALTLDATGDLYGATNAGGPVGAGTVFEVAKGSATVTTLALFNGADGQMPSGRLALDSAGNLYGTTEEGGPTVHPGQGGGGDGTVFEIVKGRATVTTLASFDVTNGDFPLGGVTLDSAGNLYGTTLDGGPSNYGTVFEVPKGTATITTLASFNNGLHPAGDLTFDSAGNLYGTTEEGGNGPGNPEGTVFELAKGSTTLTTLASFNGEMNGAEPDAGVTLDAAGNLYGTTNFTTIIGGLGGDGTVFEIAKGTTAAHTLATFNGTNGQFPNALTLGPDGNLYGTTIQGGSSGFGTVFQIPIAQRSDAITTLVSFSSAGGANPYAGVTMDATGNIYGTTHDTTIVGGYDENYGTVFEIAKGSTIATTLASFGGTNGTNPEGGVTLDSAGNLYGTTYGGGANGDGSVFELPKGSAAITTLASFNGTNGANPAASLTLDSVGNLYGTTSSTVFEITKGSTNITTLASFDGTSGQGPISRVTLDAAGNLYGATYGGGTYGDGTVFEILKGSTGVITLASFNGTNGANPVGGIAFDSAGNLYGTTTSGGPSSSPYFIGGGTVFEIVKGSTSVTTLASFGGANGAKPYGDLTLDSAGNVFGTTYSGAGTVFEVAKGSNSVTTLVLFNSANGFGPRGGLILDAAGNLYGTTSTGGVGDYGTVFKLTPPLPGDADGDGKVDFADFVIVARNYGKTNATWSDGDFNNDGSVGFDDLLIVARNYGKSVSLTASAAGAFSASVVGADSSGSPPGATSDVSELHRHQRRPRH